LHKIKACFGKNEIKIFFWNIFGQKRKIHIEANNTRLPILLFNFQEYAKLGKKEIRFDKKSALMQFFAILF